MEGSFDLSPSSSKNCLAALALSHMILAWGRSGVKFGSEWDGLSVAELLVESWIVGMDREVVLDILASMVLPSRGTIPMHPRGVC